MSRKLMTILITVILLLTACNTPSSDVTPTPDANLIQTSVVETYAAAMTQTASAEPTVQLFPTLTPSATIAPIATLASPLATIPQATTGTTRSCYSLGYVSDVTIPDNTAVTPGQTFTKTWKVVNNGSCAWDAGFKFALVSGDAMSGVTYSLPSSVPLNGIVEISIAMTAPTNKTGAVRGDWRMSTASGQFFGDQVYVIVVVGGATATKSSYP